MNAPNIYPNGPVFVPPLDYGTVAGRDLYLPLPAETGNRTAVRQAPADLPRTGHARIPPALGTPPLPLHLRFPCTGCAHDLHDALGIGHQLLRCRRGFPVDLCLCRPRRSRRASAQREVAR